MKKATPFILFIIAITFFSPGVSHAQENKSKFGIKGGLNISNLYTHDTKDENFRIGYHAGLFLKLALTDYFAIQPELLYSTKGGVLEYQNSFVAGKARFNLNYMDIPVLAVLNITDAFSIHAGPCFSVLTKVNMINDTKGSDFFDFEKELDRNDFQVFDLSLTAGLQVDIKRIGIGARYNYGFINVGKDRSFLGTDYLFPDGKMAYSSFTLP